MPRLTRVVVPLRLLLVALLAALVAAQAWALPATFARLAAESPDLAPTRWPLLALSVLGLLCVEVVIACTWRLLSMVTQDRIFTGGALRWVDAIVAAVATACALVVAALAVVAAAGLATGLPALLLGLALMAGAAFGLLLVVMRALLQQATTLRTDMDAVI